ncbi:SEC14-like protein 2 isoform X2 [Mizuhopecten yessoensis]|uniref:SEC14-like protein 2 isoform X2 n=1 Tax=Mizuhopecten yessoensis TaxID=6573 RepID=UPI000B45A4E5|nr:SEC14-like protein 2 isoform X2 [Mizuhopecten yessoensis]
MEDPGIKQDINPSGVEVELGVVDEGTKTLTAEQQSTLNTFRNQVQDVLKPDHDDNFLLRWLRARNFDLTKSEEMLRNSLIWREKHNVDTILEDFESPDVVKKYFTGGTSGFDKEGCPIWVDPLGRLDFKGLMASVGHKDLLLHKLSDLERFSKVMADQSNKLGKLIDKETIIYDMEKVGMRHLWKPGIDTFNQFVTLVEDNYPERLKFIFIINAPKIFPVIWKLVRPFVAEGTRKKIKVFGTTNYTDTLLKYIDADQLPAAYGGTLVDKLGDPRCGEMIVQGGEVPKELYANADSLERDKFTSVTVGSKQLLDLDYNVTIPESVLSWQFFTEGYDVGFAVYKRIQEGLQKGNMEEIVTPERVTSHIYPGDGSVVCKTVGTYVVRFDNTYSWTRGKKILYSVDVMAPDSMDGFSNVDICTN